MSHDIIDLCGTSSEEDDDDKKKNVAVDDDDDDDDDDIIILEDSPVKLKKRVVEKTKTPPRSKETKRKRKGPERRLKKEREMIQRSCPSSVSLVSVDSVKKWIVQIEGSSDSLFEGQKFQLQFRFDDRYPHESPEVIFIGDNIPVHEHIYSNGHICLSVLYDQWSPAMGVLTTCLSILSMLSSCTEEQHHRPENDKQYCRETIGISPKLTRWDFHDDKC